MKWAAAEESSSEGILVRDKLLLPDSGTADVVFGCETRETGEIYRQLADGLMGLGSSDISVINQVCAARPSACLHCGSSVVTCQDSHFA